MPDTDPPLPDAYLRLLAAQRVVPPEELAEMAADSARQKQRRRIKRRLPNVY